MLADELDYVIGVDPHRGTHARSGGCGHRPALLWWRRTWPQAATATYAPWWSQSAMPQAGARSRSRARAPTEKGPRVSSLAAPSACSRAAGEGALAAKRAGLCQLRDLLGTCPEPLRAELRMLSRARLLRRLQAVRPGRQQDAELRGTLLALRAVARRVQLLTAEERELKHEIEALTRELAPALLDEPGVGPVAAAQLLLSWSHPGRFASEAAFARLAGCGPIPASSGQPSRRPLRRAGQ